jgi:hypothetical protein
VRFLEVLESLHHPDAVDLIEEAKTARDSQILLTFGEFS